MTPDAVIYRYMQLVAPNKCDTDALCLLLSADADLLNRWLSLLNIPAELDTLKQRIQELDAQEFESLSAAQAWSVLPVVGSARLSLDQWLIVLRAACLAESLYRNAVQEHGHPEPDDYANVRLRTLLAISGVQLQQDSRLQALIEFRGTNPILLEDAALEMRIFTVVDAVEIGRESELAQQLLGLSQSTFDALQDEADAQAREIELQFALSGEDDDADWAHRIWMRQQIRIITGSFAQCRTWQEVSLLHQLVSRCLFSQSPLLLYQQQPESPLVMYGTSDFVINLQSQTSLVAATARGNAVRHLQEASDHAVVDRLLLRKLGTEEALVVPMQVNQCTGLLVVATEEDSDVEIAAELYAEALSQQIKQVTFQEEPPNGASDLLEQFRSAEYKRLREIVHEANNPLSIVHNYLHILELRLQHEPEAVEQLNLIASELRRAANIFATARDIPEQTQTETSVPGEIAELDAPTWLRRIAELHTGYAAEAGVALKTNLPANRLLIQTQQDKLTQIITNLTKNAIEACAPGDEVLLGARGGVYRNGRLGVELFVEDTGPGLQADVLLNLAEVKQSSKGGDHQGIGMQVAFRLAGELEGALDVRTETGQGTTFSLFLPLRDTSVDKTPIEPIKETL